MPVHGGRGMWMKWVEKGGPWVVKTLPSSVLFHHAIDMFWKFKWIGSLEPIDKSAKKIDCNLIKKDDKGEPNQFANSMMVTLIK